jgi:hypothetical protein
MQSLPIELYAKIMYSSGVISPEAKLIKEMDKNLIIDYDRIVYMEGGKSYVKHLVNMGILKSEFSYDEDIDTLYGFIDYIYFIG